MCTGCGACFYACPKQGISLVNIEPIGIRPKFDLEACAGCQKCLEICPGATVDSLQETTPRRLENEGDHAYGAALEIWEGFAAAPSIRYRGSSGGVLTALAMYCLEREHMNFVLHTAMDEEKPWRNKTVISRTREELNSRTGSRYAPSSPCDGLSAIEHSDGPCVFIGKPCDTSAVEALRRQRPNLDRNLGLVLTFFCAGTPASQGTLDLARSLDIDTDSIDSIKYRGEGWPGLFSIIHEGRQKQHTLSYGDSWSYLTHYRSLRCNLCPDGLGRVADISCGDAWEQSFIDGNPGISIIIVRSARGQRILREAVAANYVKLLPAGPAQVFAAQSNLLRRRSELFGRLFALRFFGIPVPRYRGFSLLHSWSRLSWREKARTIFGTARRIITRKLYLRGSGTRPQNTTSPKLNETVVADHAASGKAQDR
jgi:coenzyme F420 hydrogenase subunit beta